MTQQTHVAINPDSHAVQLDAWLDSRRPRSRPPAPVALVVARCVLVATLLLVTFGMPHLLRGVGSVLQ